MGKVEVVDYRLEWNKMFKEESKVIEVLLGNNCVGVYHVGSTSIKGMKAEPIVDILAVVKKGTLAEVKIAAFVENGYEFLGENGIPGQRFFKKAGNASDYHVHLFEETNVDQIRRFLAIKNYLMSNPKEAAAYSEMKASLAKQNSEDVEKYQAEKLVYIKDLEERAVKWQIKQEQLGRYMSMGMCLGMATGCALGYILGNMVSGICIGIAIGMGLGLFVGRKKAKMQEDQ